MSRSAGCSPSSDTPMSSIDSPRTTSTAGYEQVAGRVATLVATALFVAVIVSFRPFSPGGASGEAPAAGGDIVNQLGFGSLGAIAVFALLTLADPRRLVVFLSPWWILLLGFFGLSILHAADPSSALRTASFTLIGMVTMAAILVLPRDADALSRVLAAGALVVLVLCYAGLVLLPHEAMHTADSMEPEHAGFWRGVFSHKNIAGPVMACLSFIGIYLVRRSWTLVGLIIFALAMLFMANTGSKTTAGLVPMSILFVVLPGMIGMRLMTPVLFLGAVVVTALATLGIVFLDPLRDLAQQVAPGLTYTGRTALWEFSGEMIARQPWWGYGYESFWGTPFLSEQDQPFDRDWDIRGIVHGHNGYLDIAVLMGLPALAVACWTFLVEPLRDYMRIPLRRESVWLGDLFMMIALFTALNAFLETFFFRRADPVWMFFVFALLGLRLVARFPVNAPGSR
ncbi:MAG: O-antigen ligase family protein [Rhizobiaceae bacterium]|nr:O-antigen ligase family protein [Rhizobiaceae bacterium]